jgi:hypothetical protein
VSLQCQLAELMEKPLFLRESLAVIIQLNAPLTLTLSTSDGASEHIESLAASSLFSEHSRLTAIFSLSVGRREGWGEGNF